MGLYLKLPNTIGVTWIPKSLKKDEFRVLVDNRGGEYAQNKQGFVVPKAVLEQPEEGQK